MTKQLLEVKDLLKPEVLKITEDYLILYKPPKMHSAPGKGENLAGWCADSFPEILDIKGRREGEGGLIHRLDYETHGLLLFARNQEAFEKLLDCQNQGRIIKEYSAISSRSAVKPAGFPLPENHIPPLMQKTNDEQEPFIIKSFFRPYGPGRKQVRPVLPTGSGDQGNIYETKVLEKRSYNELLVFRLSLCRGFRHQIRCHLAWEGFPILNDSVYGGMENERGFLALRAGGLCFFDPASRDEVFFCLPPLLL
ncbi:MAG: RNA pseudouridine synthase [Treponema sp.]|jgi:23S rRNA pseudouridine1911/1915/1917 synthase|nr:RNA pseudouridine synthase [Treponema sp.]